MVGAAPTTRLAGQRWCWAKVEYDGSQFFGFQVQAKEPTVQGELERALEAVTGCETRISGAGRTDRGVHARGQVVAFRVEWKHSLFTLQRALNAVLSADVAILELGRAGEDFHPRFSALSRTYRYMFLNQAWRSPLVRQTAWHVAQALDTELMAQASRFLVGTHDFGSFGRPPQGENTVRRVFRVEWNVAQPFVTFEIEATAFLYRMVRSIVGTLAQVGKGRLTVAEFEAILAARDRCRVKRIAPAHGLSLMRVDYPEGVML